MTESQEQEPKPEKKTSKPRRTRPASVPRRKKPAAEKKSVAQAPPEAFVAEEIAPVAEPERQQPAADAEVTKAAPPWSHEPRTREIPSREEDDSDFNAGLWPEERLPSSPPVAKTPVEHIEPPPAVEPGPMAGLMQEDTRSEDQVHGGELPKYGEPRNGEAQNGERRRRRRGRRGRGRGRDQDTNGMPGGQRGGQQAPAGPPADLARRDQRDQRGRQGPRDLQDRRDRRESPGQRDRSQPRPQRDQHGRRDRGDRRPQPPARPQVAAQAAREEETPEVNGAGDRLMLINVSEGEECRIAIMHQGRLEELFMERASAGSHVGNIYKGRVTNVEPSIQAAFVDFGMPKNGFLHISDLQPQYFPDGMRQVEEVGRKTPRRERPPIQKCLRRGQEVLVQIIKEGIGTKGPTLTTYISIPGRFLVMLPGMNRLGVSRKIEDEDSRRKMRRILDELELPRDMGFILRTAGMDSAKRELQHDLQYLQRLWKVVANRIKNERAPCELYQESDLVIRTVRDVFSADFGKIIVDEESTAEKIRDFLSIVMPRGAAPVELYKGPQPLFHKYHIEEEIERINARHVPLPLGGSLVIDSTEALVAIDVNSGRFRDLEDAEETAYRINIEAAEEIARQLRLRDLGGLIVCDFIDMRMDKHRRAVERSLRDALKKHKERAKCLRMSQFGIIEMTRQRMRPSIKRSIYQDCPHCRGSGLVKNAESMTLDIMRLLRLTSHKEGVQTVEVRVSPSVAHQVLNRKRAVIVALEQSAGRRIMIRADNNLGLDQYLFECLDARGGVIETIEPPPDIKPGSDLRAKRNNAPAEGREGREAFEDVFE